MIRLLKRGMRPSANCSLFYVRLEDHTINKKLYSPEYRAQFNTTLLDYHVIIALCFIILLSELNSIYKIK